MIKINDEFTIERDPYCWCLHHHRKSREQLKSKGDHVTVVTYYSSLEGVFAAMMERKAGDASTINELKTFLNNLKKDIIDKINPKSIDELIRVTKYAKESEEEPTELVAPVQRRKL